MGETSTRETTADNVRRGLADAAISLSEAARQTGIPLSTLHRKASGHAPFNTDELSSLADLLGTTARELVA